VRLFGALHISLLIGIASIAAALPILCRRTLPIRECGGAPPAAAGSAAGRAGVTKRRAGRGCRPAFARLLASTIWGVSGAEAGAFVAIPLALVFAEGLRVADAAIKSLTSCGASTSRESESGVFGQPVTDHENGGYEIFMPSPRLLHATSRNLKLATPP